MYDEFLPPGDKVILSINEQISSGGAESVTKKIAQSHGMLGKTPSPPPPQILKHLSSAKIIPVTFPIMLTTYVSSYLKENDGSWRRGKLLSLSHYSHALKFWFRHPSLASSPFIRPQKLINYQR